MTLTSARAVDAQEDLGIETFLERREGRANHVASAPGVDQDVVVLRLDPDNLRRVEEDRPIALPTWHPVR